MELIKHNSNWFLSDAGCKEFASLTNLEDRSVFLYSYLKQIVKTDFDENQLLFRIAFFFADAITGSTLPYSAYPALLDPQKNPFVAYLKNADHCPGINVVYYIFLSILHGIAAPFKHNDWVYERQLEDPEYMEEKLTALGKRFCSGSVDLADADAFAIEESLQTVQLKLIWLMGQQ